MRSKRFSGRERSLTSASVLPLSSAASSSAPMAKVWPTNAFASEYTIFPVAVQTLTRTTRALRTRSVTTASRLLIAAGLPAISAVVSSGATIPRASIWVMTSASLIASAVADPLTTQKLAPPIRAAARAHPTTNRSTSRLTEIGWAVDERTASRVREDGRIRGSRSVNEQSTASVWAGRRGRLVACPRQPGYACYAVALPEDDTPSSVRRRPQARAASRSMSCAGGQGCRTAPGGADRSRDPAFGGGTARRRQQWQQPAPARPR